MRAMLLQVLYSVRSEGQLVEQIQYNLMLRWFVGLSIEDSVWNHSVFSKNRDRLIEHDERGLSSQVGTQRIRCVECACVIQRTYL